MSPFNLSRDRFARRRLSRKRHAQFVFFGNMPIDLVARPVEKSVGAKQVAMITDRLGGPAGNGSPVVVANGVSCAAVATQAEGLGFDYCLRKGAELKMRMHLLRSPAGKPALTVAMPTDVEGQLHLFVQRAGSPFSVDLDACSRRWAKHAKVLFIGPVSIDSDTLRRLHQLLDASPRSYKVLMPHPSLIVHPGFRELAAKCSYVQLNRVEAALIDSSTKEMLKHALRLLFMLPKTEFAITNQDQRGLLWTGARWLEINPEKQRLVCDIGLGDAFGTAYALCRGVFRADPSSALAYAIKVSAQIAAGRPIPPFLCNPGAAVRQQRAQQADWASASQFR